MALLKRKVNKLMKRYNSSMNSSITKSKEQYHKLFLESRQELPVDEEDQISLVAEDDLLQSTKMTNIPNRKQIKALSARVIEEVAKRED